MKPNIPCLEDYGLSELTGFLPPELPLTRLKSTYYEPWEAIAGDLQALLYTGRLRQIVDKLPQLSVKGLATVASKRRAFAVLGFIAHAYVWAEADRPSDTIPAQISVPWEHLATELELRPVMCYTACCLWNHRPILGGGADGNVSSSEGLDLSDMATISTFTGSIDESWFYLVSTRVEVLGGPILRKIIDSMHAVRRDDKQTVQNNLYVLAEHISEVADTVKRMYEHCDPYVFYHRIRPILAGWNNMSDAGLPKGVKYLGCPSSPDDSKAGYRRYAGGSAAQSPLIQALDIGLGVEHWPTGGHPSAAQDSGSEGSTAPPKNNFIHEMRKYMPGPHRRFLEHLSTVTNIRDYCMESNDDGLMEAYDACIAIMKHFRDIHLQIVSRYILIAAQIKPKHDKDETKRVGLAGTEISRAGMTGTGGTSLIPFLKQARSETADRIGSKYARSIIAKEFGRKRAAAVGGDIAVPDDFVQNAPSQQHENNESQYVGLAGKWDDGDGGLCLL